MQMLFTALYTNDWCMVQSHIHRFETQHLLCDTFKIMHDVLPSPEHWLFWGIPLSLDTVGQSTPMQDPFVHIALASNDHTLTRGPRPHTNTGANHQISADESNTPALSYSTVQLPKSLQIDSTSHAPTHDQATIFGERTGWCVDLSCSNLAAGTSNGAL